MPLLIIDIDGTIADCSHRLHFVKDKDYESFYKADEMLKDTPIKPVIKLIESLADWDKVMLTGRPEMTRATTMKWLSENLTIEVPPMYMRPDGNYTKSSELKPLMIDEILRNHPASDIYALDDDLSNCEAMKQMGVTVLCLPRI